MAGLSSEPDDAGQAGNIGDFDIAVIGIGRFMAAIDPDLVLDAEIVRRHQIVAEGGRHMQDVLRAATEHVEHIFERLEMRFVGLCLFGRIDGMERCAEFCNIRHDL